MQALDDFSPALREARQQLVALYAQKGAIEDRYRQLTTRKMNGGTSADDKQARVQAALEGKTLPPAPSIDALLAAEQANFNAICDAIHLKSGDLRTLERDAAHKFAEARKPQHDKAMKKLGTAMTDVHGALVELGDLKWDLLNNGGGLAAGLFSIGLPDSLERPRDRSSDLGDFFRTMKAAGFVSAVPKELR